MKPTSTISVTSTSEPASQGQSPRFHLRAVTRGEHDATEAAFARFDLSRRDGYRDFLLVHAAALGSLEPQFGRRGWPGWTSRLGLLEADLADLEAGIYVPTGELTGGAVTFLSDAQVWGSQYVLEGSRLGGQVLAAQVEPGCPTRYLRGFDGERQPAERPWQRFCAALDEAAKEHGEQWLADVERGARSGFAVFRQAADDFSGYSI